MHPFEQVPPAEVSCSDTRSLRSLLRTLEQSASKNGIEIPCENTAQDDRIREYSDHEIGLEIVNPIHELLCKNTVDETLRTSTQLPNGGHSATSVAQNLDQNGDFSYSQKLFHIADGNLYSIFSPLQGRSYGVKPSFLRKQRCTVQECHGRGRKNLRKGLKFHNFLPSESVTSEKDNSNFEDKWKVHSECRLREEHGTKQIMISNWSSSIEQQPTVQNSNEKCELNPNFRDCSESVKVPFENESEDGEIFSNHSDIANCFLTSPSVNPVSEISNVSNSAGKLSFNQTSFQESNSKQCSMLDSMLTSIENSSMQGNLASFHAESEESEGLDKLNTLHCEKRHRRKPVHTRRVVPYVKYLSLLEENESCPLDLSRSSPAKFSCKSKHLQNVDSSERELKHHAKEIEEILLEPTMFSSKSLEALSSTAANSSDNDRFSSNHTSNHLPSANANRENTSEFHTNVPLTFLYPLSMKQTNSYFSENFSINRDFNVGILTNEGNVPSYCSSVLTQNSPDLKSILNFNESACSTSSGVCPVKDSHKCVEGLPSVKAINHRKPRKRSQRSVIKQKLEDTFRENGFLVKTKQVSDGEATFCKFRQLRKYTRYYLKSWQQHLPEEVNKMWKGFLPPKTILPPVLGTGPNNQ